MPSTATEAFDKVSAAFRAGRTRPKDWRISQLEAIERLLELEEHVLLDALERDLGKPRTEAWMTDLAPVASEASYMRRHLGRWMKPAFTWAGKVNLPGVAWSVAEPKGVVLVISPWNYPVNLSLIPLAAALAAGNSVVLKPSEMTPSTSETLARLVGSYLDTDAVAVVEGAVPAAQELLELPFDHVFFTGSTSVGRVVMQSAAKHLSSVTLELGGKSPVIVAADADIATAGRRIAWGKLVNAGQTCLAPDYVLAERSVFDDLVDSVVASLQALQGSDPGVTRTSIVNDQHVRRLSGLLESSQGKVVLGGGVDADKRWIEPTVVVEPDTSSRLMQDEIFGPILPVLAVDRVADAVDFVSSRPKPLALYLFTSSRETERAVLFGTTSGSVCVNHVMTQFLVPDLPFGGVGPSGMGAYHGRAGFEELSHRKSVLRRRPRPDPSVAYPPYAPWKERLLRKVL